jgi:hypothetical protein
MNEGKNQGFRYYVCISLSLKEIVSIQKVLYVFMKTNRRFLLIFCTVYFLILAGLLGFYIANPFKNKCIEGNCKTGHGIFKYNSGIQYDGLWEKARKNGEGVIQYPDGRKYKGGWENDKRNGQGTMYYSDGKRYEGDWRDSKRQGWGVLTYPNGTRYEGNWSNNRRHGKGIMTYFDGTKYDGEWKKDKFLKCTRGNCLTGYGRGFLISKDILFVTNWFNGNLHGYGTILYPDGRRYKGSWRNGMLHGRGKYTLHDETVLHMEWKNDHPIAPGIMIMADGRKYKVRESDIDYMFSDTKLLWKLDH